jgi:hypothetical protein
MAERKASNKRKPTGQVKKPAGNEKTAVTKPAPAAERHGWRRFLAGSFVMIACVLLILSIYAVFLQQTILDTETYTTNMREIIKEPAVKKAVAGYATDELFTALEVQKRISDVLPEKIRIAAVPATTWLKGFTSQQIEALMGTKQFQDIWASANETAHKNIVAVLRGETQQVKVSDDGTLYIDFMPIVKDLALRLTENTKLHNLVSKIPAGAVGPALKAGLSTALGVDLPADFGQLKIIQAKQLARARQFVAALDAAASWLPIASIAFIGMALGISVDRRRTVMHLGAGVAAAAVIGALLSQIAVEQALLSIADDTVRSLVTTIAEIELRGLPSLFLYAGLAGAVVFLIAFLVGQGATYAKFDAWIRSIIGYATEEDLARHPVMSWINKYVDTLRMVVVFLAFVALLLIKGWWGVAMFGVILAIGEAKLRYLTGWYPFSKPGVTA